MVVKFEWAYCWLDQSPRVSEMKAPQKNGQLVSFEPVALARRTTEDAEENKKTKTNKMNIWLPAAVSFRGNNNIVARRLIFEIVNRNLFSKQLRAIPLSHWDAHRILTERFSEALI